ncbi:MAG: HAMP domain-containing histidine kinase [Fimbriimonadaceae bacterium]|nr:HAMP domain-containing histidine kinase [Chitinophagales bacterium]
MVNLYEKKSRWKLILFFVALTIVGATLWYTSMLAKKLAEEEKNKVEQIANVYKYISTATDIVNYGFFIELIQSNKTVPIISTDNDGNIIAFLNIDSAKATNDSLYVQEQLEEMKKFAEPITFEIAENTFQYIYYKHSFLYTQLRYYPLIQLLIITGFLIASYILFNTARKSEQNRVWVGMAKETAHQLGTPISSLVAWIDYLKESTGNVEQKKNIIDEMDKDVKRLELIADRFSKVGSSPALVNRNIIKDLENTFDYIKRRASKKVNFTLKYSKEEIHANINPTLFNWVIENILKNALDAIDGNGDIELHIQEADKSVFIDITDSGKGIPKSKFATVFEPGYSTKKRGWGLGLTLAKRITENYHNGKIFVKNSVSGKGTTFRIVLPKA